MKQQYNILGVTLARSGSKGVKNKNIKKINNFPLIYYTIKEAKKVSRLTNYIVSTDSEYIKKVSNKYGADTPFLRPKKLSGDNTSSSEALIHAVIECEKIYKIKYDFVIELMATNPMKTYVDINNCINILIKNEADSVIGVSEVHEFHPGRIKKIEKGKIVDFCIKENSYRRQDLKPKAYIRNGSIYALKRKTIMIDKKRFGSKKSIPYIMSEKKSVNIDSKLDFIVAKELLKK